MQPVQHRNHHKTAARWLRPHYCRIRIRYPVQSLMDAAVVVPADEFCKYTSKMSFAPDQHSVETLPAKRPYQPLNVCRCIGRALRNRYSSDAHLLPEPRIVCRSTRSPLFPALHSKRTSKLTELPVVVVEQEPGLLIEAGVPDLLFCPLEGWMLGYVQVDDLATRKLHYHENVENTKSNRVLHKEVTGPHGLGLVLQKASPGLGICRSRTLSDHVSPDGRTGVANSELHLQLQSDSILAVFRMIGGCPPDEGDVYIWNCRSARPALGPYPPELPKLPLPPSDHGLWPHENQLRSPVSPDPVGSRNSNVR